MGPGERKETLEQDENVPLVRKLFCPGEGRGEARYLWHEWYYLVRYGSRSSESNPTLHLPHLPMLGERGGGEIALTTETAPGPVTVSLERDYLKCQ